MRYARGIWGHLRVEHPPWRKSTAQQIAKRDAEVDRLAEEFRAKNNLDSSSDSESNLQETVQTKEDAPQRKADGSASKATHKPL